MDLRKKLLMFFKNREDAGRQLAEALGDFASRENTVVFGLPRGGVVVAAEVADALHAPLDVLLVRKLGVPGHEELAAGAIAEQGIRIINRSVLRSLRLPESDLDDVVQRERQLLRKRAELYRGFADPLPVTGMTVIVVDDGLATGATMRAGVRALQERNPLTVVIAVPVAPPDTVDALRYVADDFVCLHSPADFGGVGRWYEEFPQVDDETVVELLRKHSSMSTG